MAKKCARTFSIVVEKGKKSILEVRHLLPVGIARYVRLIECPLHSIIYKLCTNKIRLY